VLIEAGGLVGQLQRASAAQRPHEVDVALVDLAGGARHFTLIAFDGDADLVVETEHAQVEITIAADCQTRNLRLEIGVVGHAVAHAGVALELAEGRVLAAWRVAQRLAVEGGDATAQLLFEVGVDQYAVVEDEAGVAVERLDPLLLAVAAGIEFGVEVELTLDRRRLIVLLQQRLQRYAAEAFFHADHRFGLAHVDTPVAGEAATLHLATHFFQANQAATAAGLEIDVGEGLLVVGELAEAQCQLQVELAQLIHRQHPLVAPGLLRGRIG